MAIMYTIVLVAFAAAAAWSLGVQRDDGRIRRYIEDRGGQVLEIRWTPFGPGCLGERSNRLYLVRYLDSSGAECESYCKTSRTTGVYFTDDRRWNDGEPSANELPDRTSAAIEPSALLLENQRLKAELERLREANKPTDGRSTESR